MSKYILNIKTGKIHDGKKPCAPCNQAKKSNLKFFDNYNDAINYFEGLGASQNEPVFTRLQGRLISEVVVRRVTEEGAWGEPIIKEYSSTRKDYVITWAAAEPYAWEDESGITAAELKKAMADREVYLAGVKSRQDEYKASRGQATAAPATGGFNF